MDVDLRKIAKIHFKMERIASGLFSGLYRSHFKGRGIEFEEVRAFQIGDEVRSIDWNVTARMGTPYVKLFREERELTLMLMLDISGSMQFGSREQLKRDLLSEIGAIFAYSGIKNRDRVGLILFSDRIEHYVPPQKGLRSLLRLIRDLILFPAKSHGTDLETALSFLGKVQKKRSVVILLSDFIRSGNGKKAATLIAKKHDLIAIAVHDPLEKLIPPVGLLECKDLESDEQIICDPEEEYSIEPKGREHLKSTMEKCGAAWIEVATDQPYLPKLLRFLASRRGR